tara:strand:- start:1443 stop:2981 length:1539 start_codon:yes stop_codon:yes gene_type:complete
MDRFTQSLLGQGDYADAGMILPFAITPEGERVFSFPQALQGLGRTVGRATGLLPMEYDAETGLPSEDILMDAFDAAGSFTGAGLLAPRPANSLGMGGRIEDMPLFQQIGKRPMSRALPPAEQALYEAGAAMQLPRESGEGLLLPQRAYDLGAAEARVLDEGLAVDPGFQNMAAPFIPAEQTDTVIRDVGTLLPSATVDLQSLIGQTAKLMPGDMTMAGKEITHVMGVKLKNPVRMQGGKDFSAEQLSRELGLVWASDPAVISGYARQARDNPGLLGIYSAMGARSGDFSHHVADVVVDMTKQADWIPKSEIKRFDDEMRKFTVTTERPDGTKVSSQPFEDFPGILSDEVEAYIYSPGKGGARKAIADIMEKASYRKKGFPDLSVIRTVVADPEMRYRVNDPSAMMAPTGGRIVRFDDDPMTPIGGEGNVPMFHKTYRQGISGEDLGGLEMPVPRSLIFPEFFANRRAADKAMSSDRRSAEISNVMQTITPEIADDVSVFQDMYRRGLLGDVF